MSCKGIPNWPYSLDPKLNTLPSRVRAKVCSLPAETDAQRSDDGTTTGSGLALVGDPDL